MCQVARRAGFFPLAPHSVAPREIEASLTAEITFLSGFPDSRHTLPAHRADKLHIYRHWSFSSAASSNCLYSTFSGFPSQLHPQLKHFFCGIGGNVAITIFCSSAPHFGHVSTKMLILPSSVHRRICCRHRSGLGCVSSQPHRLFGQSGHRKSIFRLHTVSFLGSPLGRHNQGTERPRFQVRSRGVLP